MTAPARSIGTLLATMGTVLALAACGGDGPAPPDDGGDDTPEPTGPIDPGPVPPIPGSTNSRWFGAVTVGSRIIVDRVENSVPGLSIRDRFDAQSETRIEVDETGKRTVTSQGRVVGSQFVVLTAGCATQTTRTFYSAPEAKASGSSQGYFTVVEGAGSGLTGNEVADNFNVPNPLRDATFSLAEAPVQVSLSSTFDRSAEELTDACGEVFEQNISTSEPYDFGTPAPLDRVRGRPTLEGNALSGSVFYTEGGVEYDVTWNLKRDREIVAKAGDYQVVRANDVTLDASASRGDITEYRWSLKPTGECANMGNEFIGEAQSIGERVLREGKTFRFKVLCPVEVSLRVSGPRGADVDHTLIRVVPRGWETSFKTVPGPPVPTVLSDIGVAGRDRCEIEGGDEETGHVIHRTDLATWVGDVYQTSRVTDNGPFNRVFYVGSSSVRISRGQIVNTQWLPPNGPVYLLNLFLAPALHESIIAHEEAHGALIQGWWERRKARPADPARRVERLASTDIGILQQVADASLRDDETQVCIATNHQRVFAILRANPTFEFGPGQVQFPGEGIPTNFTKLYLLGNDTEPCNLR